MEPFEAKFNGVEIVAWAKSLHISFSYFTATGQKKKRTEEEIFLEFHDWKGICLYKFPSSTGIIITI